MTSETPALTPLEAQVLALVVQGRTNAQIRAELGLRRHALAPPLEPAIPQKWPSRAVPAVCPQGIAATLDGMGPHYFAGLAEVSLLMMAFKKHKWRRQSNARR